MRFCLYMLLATFFAVRLISPAIGQDCNPKDFTWEDIKKVGFSETVQMSAYSTFDESRKNSDNKTIGGTAVVYGVPVSLHSDEAKVMADHVLSQSGFNFDRNTKLSFVTTALSSVGENMYENCLSVSNIKVDVPQSAFTESSFFLNIKWTPQEKRAPNETKFVIKIINGTINNRKSILEGTIRRFSSPPGFEITKNNGKLPLQIAINIDELNYPPIFIPPAQILKKFGTVKRSGIRTPPVNTVGNICTDHAYLVDEVGSNAGNGPRHCKLTVEATSGGILLPSTATIDARLSSNGAHYKMELGNSPYLEESGEFWTDGAGIGSGKFEVDDGKFTVWEVAPQ